eukprot:TRINITY_DN49176_c0_g1_i1.p1 TRINITY_DN49176_c0_g1~~TRINITY_DN49176_c0_g1_i1.p1  ORF type:complete len:201 (-),score=18.08 TRINITY_DN49176_c0_g1_i1:251-826(-)
MGEWSVPTSKRLNYTFANLNDIDDLLLLFSDPQSMQYVPHLRKQWTREDMRGRVEEQIKKILEKQLCIFHLRENTTGTLVGTAGLMDLNFEEKQAEVGLLLSSSFHRKGFGTECLLAILDMGFFYFGLQQIKAITSQDHTAMKGLFTKYGMVHVRDFEIVPGDPVSEFLVVATNWPAMKAKMEENLKQHTE